MNNIGLEFVFWTVLSVYLLAKLGVFKKKRDYNSGILKVSNNGTGHYIPDTTHQKEKIIIIPLDQELMSEKS